MEGRIRKYYEQLISIRDGLEEIRDFYEGTDNDEEFECLDSCVDSLSDAIDNLEVVLNEGDPDIRITIQLG